MKRLILVLALLSSTVAVGRAADLLKPADSFPAWSLTDHMGRPVSSRDLSGKTYLLWFYPKAMTPGCTAEGDGLRDKFADLQKSGVEVLGVSFDQPENNARFVREQQFPFRLLSDMQHTFAVAVGAADSAQQPVARRISYLVGPDAKVLRVYGAVSPATHAEDVLRDLPAAR